MRPIDADVLIPLIQEDKIEGKTLDIVKALGDGLQAETLNQSCDRHIKIINNLPTIDAVPVVRCKDCKHYWRNHADDISVSVCLASPEDDAFCSEGERKDDVRSVD